MRHEISRKVVCYKIQFSENNFEVIRGHFERPETPWTILCGVVEPDGFSQDVLHDYHFTQTWLKSSSRVEPNSYHRNLVERRLYTGFIFHMNFLCTIIIFNSQL